MHGTQVQGMRNGGRMPHWPPTAANAAKARERERERSQLLKSRRSLLVAYLGLSRQPSIGLPPSNHDAEAEGSSKQQSPYRPRIRGRSARSPPGLLSQQEVESVHAELPLRHRLCDWQLLYGLEEHGCSLNTFYKLTKGYEQTVLLVMDTDTNAVFGAFAPVEWRVADSFYGSGEAMLFSLRPTKEVQRWSGRNSFFMLSNERSIALGAGGCFGLWLGEDFSTGSAGPCETFEMSTIAPTREFKCATVEVYGLVPPSLHNSQD